jgi:hypothetical protein
MVVTIPRPHALLSHDGGDRHTTPHALLSHDGGDHLTAAIFGEAEVQPTGRHRL